MRVNDLKRVLGNGGVALGTMIAEFATSGIARITAGAGAEFVLFDMEHTGWSLETIRQLMATTRATDLTPLVRVPTSEGYFITGALDVGAAGVAVPQVETAEQARAIVTAAKYPPLGRRGVSAGVAHDDYCVGNVAEAIEHANREVLLIAQIETARGAGHCDAIAAVPGIDVLWLGQYDLTASLGIPGQFTHPDFLAARRAVVQACKRHDKVGLYGCGNVDELAAAAADGFRLLMYTSDISIYQRALSRALDEVREEIPPAGKISHSRG
jgi:2-keto-3-deoxy-L-rhamnonate aldolase RhmA